MRKIFSSTFKRLGSLKAAKDLKMSTLPNNNIQNSSTAGPLTIGGYVLSGSSVISGSCLPPLRREVYVLTADLNSFNTFLALSESVDRSKNDYIFVEKPEDVGNSRIIILDDFCLNPNIIEILKVVNKGLYRRSYDNDITVSSSGNVGIGSCSNSSTINQRLIITTSNNTNP